MDRTTAIDRRSFVAIGGLVIAAACFGLGGASKGLFGASTPGKLLFTTSSATAGEALGPAVRGDIGLYETAEGIQAFYDDTLLFAVDDLGAKLVALADGSLSVEQIAARVSEGAAGMVLPAQVAAFFVTLGQAGYLQQAFMVNLVENYE